MTIRGVAVALLVLQAAAWAKQPEDEDPTSEADRLAAEINAKDAAAVDAQNAQNAAATAKQAAVVANKVAEHSIKVTGHAKKALTHALSALHDARVESSGMDSSQKQSLKKAEAKLREATKTAEYGKLKKIKDSSDLEKQEMQRNLDKKSKKGKKSTELEQMRQDVKELRKNLKEKGGDEESVEELEDLEKSLEEMEKANKGKGKGDASSDEMKAEIERLREQINKIEDRNASHSLPEGRKGSKDGKGSKAKDSDKELMRDVSLKPLGAAEDSRGSNGDRGSVRQLRAGGHEATPVEEKGIDIDTAMPYGDLEPFGREDTAQELTESSVRESDEMVDQLERAEVAEEKRAVFRALTRLRGAAITSFDGVARSQTGNIDEYNKVNKWRRSHPLHHLADEEADITKWAFPDNADLVQLGEKAGTTAFEKCDGQERFDVMMCKSHMCTKCTLAYCMETCQKTQKDFPTCRCSDWPKLRASYSGGDFAGKGKAGDAGDYAKAASAFLSVEIREDN